MKMNAATSRAETAPLATAMMRMEEDGEIVPTPSPKSSYRNSDTFRLAGVKLS